MSSINDKFKKVKGFFSTTLASQKNISATSMSLSDATGVPTDTGLVFTVGRVNSSGTPTPTTRAIYKGTLSGTTVSNLTLTEGTDQTHPAGTVVEITWTQTHVNDMVDGILTHSNQDGTLKTNAVHSSAVLANNVVTTAKINDTSVTIAKLSTSLQDSINSGWTSLSATPSSVTGGGDGVYDLTFSGDLTGTISPGMKIRTTRTVAAPVNSFSLDGINDYFNRTSVAGMTFTDDFVVSAWIYLLSYPSIEAHIASRFNGTNGWRLDIDSSGRLRIIGHNGGLSNFRYVRSYESIPLNRWVHVAAQLDMSTWTLSSTTNYIMFNGVNIAAELITGGTAPTSLVQAGNLEVGSFNGGTNIFSGYIDQLAIYGNKVTQANITARLNRALSGTESDLVSAYSNGSLNDLNTTNANNLTAQNGATTINRSAFGNEGASSTLDYSQIISTSFSGGNTTVKVKTIDGCTIPTSGGVSSVHYSSMHRPYGYTSKKAMHWRTIVATTQGSIVSAVDISGAERTVNVPRGAALQISYRGNLQSTVAGDVGSIRLFEDGTLRHVTYSVMRNANTQENNQATLIYHPTPGEHTYKLRAQRDAGSGTFSNVCDLNVPTLLEIQVLE